jgi:hypothetical protein
LNSRYPAIPAKLAECGLFPASNLIFSANLSVFVHLDSSCSILIALKTSLGLFAASEKNKKTEEKIRTNQTGENQKKIKRKAPNQVSEKVAMT